MVANSSTQSCDTVTRPNVVPNGGLNNTLNNTLNNSLNNRPIISQQLASKYAKDLQTKRLPEQERIERQHDIRARSAWLEAQGRKTRVGSRHKALLKGVKEIKEDTSLIPGIKEDVCEIKNILISAKAPVQKAVASINVAQAKSALKTTKKAIDDATKAFTTYDAIPPRKTLRKQDTKIAWGAKFAHAQRALTSLREHFSATTDFEQNIQPLSHDFKLLCKAAGIDESSGEPTDRDTCPDDPASTEADSVNQTNDNELCSTAPPNKKQRTDTEPALLPKTPVQGGEPIAEQGGEQNIVSETEITHVIPTVQPAKLHLNVRDIPSQFLKPLYAQIINPLCFSKRSVVVLRDVHGKSVPVELKDVAITLTAVYPERNTAEFIASGKCHTWYLDGIDYVKPRVHEIDPTLKDWHATNVGREIKCGHPTRAGGFCNWSSDCRLHPTHEENALELEDRLSYTFERGICGVQFRNGGICVKPRAQCSTHAPEEKRCNSMIEDDCESRCWNFRQKDSEYCHCHTDFPNLSVNAKLYGNQVHEQFKRVCDLAEFLKMFYPNASPSLFPKKPEDFLKYLEQMSGHQDLCQASYLTTKNTNLLVELKKTIDMLLFAHGNADWHAAHVSHTLSDRGMPFSAYATDAGFEIRMDVKGKEIKLASLILRT